MIIGQSLAASGGGGASGNFTFSFAQVASDAGGADPGGATLGTPITAGNLLVAIVAERSGGDETTYVVTDNNSKTWNEVTAARIDNSVPGDETNTRMTASVFWRKVDSTGETDTTPLVTVDDGTANSKYCLIVEISPSATYGWALAGGTPVAVNGSGASDWDNTNGGNASPTGDDILVVSIAAARLSTDKPLSTDLDFDERNGTVQAAVGGSNKMAFILNITTTSQAGTGTYTSTIDTTAAGSGNEGICGTICFQDV